MKMKSADLEWPQSEKPELEAVAHRWRQPRGAYIYFDGPDPKEPRDESLDLCSLPAAQALLAQRDERIEELEQAIRELQDWKERHK